MKWLGTILFTAFLTTTLCISSCSVRRSVPVKGPLVLEDSSAIKGQIQFMAKCQRCHPMGESGLGLAINNKPFPNFVKRFQVRHGLGVMPSFDDDEISDEELDNILSYLKALKNNSKGEKGW